jgi:hypothetical protein
MGGHDVATQRVAAQPLLARTQVLQLLEQGYSSYNRPEEFSEAMAQLIMENPTPAPGAATMELGQGTWEVGGATPLLCWPAPGCIHALYCPALETYCPTTQHPCHTASGLPGGGHARTLRAAVQTQGRKAAHPISSPCSAHMHLPSEPAAAVSGAASPTDK